MRLVPLIQSSHLAVNTARHHHAGAGNCAEVLCYAQPGHEPEVTSWELFMRMASNAAHPDNHACVLYRIVRVIQHRPHCAYVLPLGKHQHLLQPVGRDDSMSLLSSNILAACIPKPKLMTE